MRAYELALDKTDVDAMCKLAQDKLLANKYDGSLLIKYISEIQRSHNMELHSVAAWLGGSASVESLKILTLQYVPVDNTIIYDGMTQLVHTMRI